MHFSSKMELNELFLLILLISSTSALSIPLEAARSVGLLPRADPVCGGNTNLTQCGGDFPTSFCCPKGSTCFGFNKDQSVICCPQKECGFINTLSCDPAVYNATAFPSSPIHMVDLSSAAYIPCNGTNNCCPKGYSCSGGGCQLDISNAAATSGIASAANPSASATTAPSSILSLSSVPTPSAVTTDSPGVTNGSPAAAATNTSSPSTTSSAPQFPLQAILIGLFPGLAAGCLLAFLLMCLLGRRKAKKLSSDSSSSLGPTVAKISDPIYAVDPTATRTDFLRHASRRVIRKASRPLLGGSHAGSTPSGESSISRVRSLFRKTPNSESIGSGSNTLWGTTPTHPRNHDGQVLDPSPAVERALDARLGRMNTTSTTGGPRTPKREPSMESIPIYNNTPDAGAGYERNTLFADLLPAVNPRSASDPVPRIPDRPAREQTGLMPPIYMGDPLNINRRDDRRAFS